MYFKNIYNMYRVCGPSLFFGSCVLSLFILNYETVTLFFYFDIAIYYFVWERGIGYYYSPQLMDIIGNNSSSGDMLLLPLH